MNDQVYAVLLAGGSGTRLWPVSRQQFPKQLVRFFGDGSLIQETVWRLTPVIDPQRIYVVCGADHAGGIADDLQKKGGQPSDNIIAEPCGRNTAPAILLATLSIMKHAQDPIICVFPADHVIGDTQAFHHTLDTAIQVAGRGHIVTFGIQPSYPETGFGYIEAGDLLDGEGRRVERFVEKPDRATAEHYVNTGRYFWNSGMFVFKGSVICREFKTLLPEMWTHLSEMVEKGATISEDQYRRLENISIDYGVMEKTDRCAVVPADFGWSDIGSWKSLYDFAEKDEQGNVAQGDVLFQDTRNSLVFSTHRLVAVNRMDGAAVVETPDAVFVSDLTDSREVKKIVETLKAKQRPEYQRHPSPLFSTGQETLVEDADSYSVRKLRLEPGQSAPLSKKSANTCLVCLQGAGRLSTGDQQTSLQPGDTLVFEQAGSIELKNTDDQPLVVLIIDVGQ